VIWLAWEIVTRLSGTEDLLVEINSLGCEKCRPIHRKELMLYLENNRQDLCEDCRRRMKVNPLRIFDCKNEDCRRNLMLAPVMKHYLCPDCAGHMGIVLDILEAYGVPFVQNPYLVRGLDYYVRTTFEITSKKLGAQSTVAAGGRYDGLVKLLGGPDIPGVGMAVGVERLLLLMDETVSRKGADLFIAALGREPRDEAYYWIGYLRRQGVRVEFSFADKSLKAQMKQADRAGARYCLIFGENELDEEIAILRDMATKEQEEISLDDLPEGLVDRITKQSAGE
jgi:histidyl-tRNA synthetase